MYFYFFDRQDRIQKVKSSQFINISSVNPSSGPRCSCWWCLLLCCRFSDWVPLGMLKQRIWWQEKVLCILHALKVTHSSSGTKEFKTCFHPLFFPTSNSPNRKEKRKTKLPETNSSHLRMMVSKFGISEFPGGYEIRCHVSFREGINVVPGPGCDRVPCAPCAALSCIRTERQYLGGMAIMLPPTRGG